MIATRLTLLLLLGATLPALASAALPAGVGPASPTSMASPDAQHGRPAKKPQAKTPPAKARAGTSTGRSILGRPDTEQGAGRPSAAPVVPLVTGDPLGIGASDDLSEQIRGWFDICDYDENDWISFRESRSALAFTRSRFGLYDADRDGRFELGEFVEYHDDSVSQIGAFRPPRAEPAALRQPQRSPELLRLAYDRDLDGRIGRIELSWLLSQYDRADVSTDALLASLDTNEDLTLSLGELDPLVDILYPVVSGDEAPVEGESRAGPLTRVEDLFGEVVIRGREDGSNLSPPMIKGPVPVFRRLDLDDDGAATLADLEALLRPLQVPVRLHSVLHTLDLDGDGKLTANEFEAALKRR